MKATLLFEVCLYTAFVYLYNIRLYYIELIYSIIFIPLILVLKKHFGLLVNVMTVNGHCHSTGAIKILYKSIVKHLLVSQYGKINLTMFFTALIYHYQ